MTVVTSALLDPTGTPLPDHVIRAELVASEQWLADNSGRIISQARTRTDTTGQWSLDLTPQSEIAEDGSYYRITEDGGTHLCQVPDSGPVTLATILYSPEV